MKMIENMYCVREVVAHRTDVRWGHIGRDGLDLGARSSQALPEGIESIGAFAIPHEHDRAGEQIEHDGQVLVPLTNVDFIDGDLFELMELGLAETALQIGRLDF